MKRPLATIFFKSFRVDPPDMIFSFTSSGVKVGSFSRINAAAPATIGEAIDVP